VYLRHFLCQFFIMSSLYPTTLALLSLLPLALSLTPLQTLYPPILNDTSYITNDTLGTYGGIYSSPTQSSNTSAPYGTYDYCQMPHPRAQEYQLPGPIRNGSAKGNLVYVEYLQRHQRRTPYNILPGGEVRLFFPYSLNCDTCHVIV